MLLRRVQRRLQAAPRARAAGCCVCGEISGVVRLHV
jgi:hypothetical protein